MAYRALGALGAASLAWSQLTCADPFWRSKHHVKPQDKPESGFLLFSGNSNQPLAAEIAHSLGTELGRVHLSRFADGEVAVKILEHLRGRDVFVVQSTCPPVNEHLMELILLISAMRRSSAKKITAVIPYYGYARQDRKMMSRVPISAADIARLLEVVGVDRVISCDLHCGQIQGFFGPKTPVDNLDAGIVGIEHFTHYSFNNPVIVSPDAGGVYRAKQFQEFLDRKGVQSSLAMIVKQRSQANQVDEMTLVGDVAGCDVILVDDIIDTAGTLCKAAETLQQNGANKIYAYASHGLFTRDALDKIDASPITEVVVTNTIPLPTSGSLTKITQVTVGVLLAEAVRRSHQRESMSELFAK